MKGVLDYQGAKTENCNARAILKDAPIIIFDEATAALDSESEKFIQLAIENISKRKPV